MDTCTQYENLLIQTLQENGLEVEIVDKESMLKAQSYYSDIYVDLAFSDVNHSKTLEQMDNQTDKLLKEHVQSGVSSLFVSGKNEVLVSPSAKEPGNYQITYFDRKGALSDIQKETIDNVAEELKGRHCIPLRKEFAEFVVERKNERSLVITETQKDNNKKNEKGAFDMSEQKTIEVVFEVEIWNESSYKDGVIDTFNTLEEAQKCAEEEINELWREQTELKHGEKSELRINHLELNGEEIETSESHTFATIYKNYIVIEEHEEQLKALDNVTIYNLSNLGGYHQLKDSFKSEEAFEEFEIELEEAFLRTDGHLYSVEIEENVFEWFDNAEEALERLNEDNISHEPKIENFYEDNQPIIRLDDELEL